MTDPGSTLDFVASISTTAFGLEVVEFCRVPDLGEEDFFLSESDLVFGIGFCRAAFDFGESDLCLTSPVSLDFGLKGESASATAFGLGLTEALRVFGDIDFTF